VDKVAEVRDKIPQIKKVIYEDSRGMRSYQTDDWFMYIEDLYTLGEQLHQDNPDLFESLINEGKPDDVCHFCLTTGTTG
jgi:long-chain acyl-CoA synthetase